MKILSWNVKGYNASDKIHLIKRCFDQTRLSIVLLQETKIKEKDFDSFLKCFGKWKGCLSRAVGASGGLGILWEEALVNVRVERQDQSWQWVSVASKQLCASFDILIVYGPPGGAQKL